jgi:hypothetical protein
MDLQLTNEEPLLEMGDRGNAELIGPYFLDHDPSDKHTESTDNETRTQCDQFEALVVLFAGGALVRLERRPLTLDPILTFSIRYNNIIF